MKLESNISARAGFLYTAPLLDGVLLLLVFFIFGSSFVLKSGVQVTLPSSASALPEARDAHIITIQDGKPAKVYFNESRVDETQLQTKLQTSKLSSNQVTILADQNTDYGAVMEVAIEALKYGYEVSFGTQPAQE